MFMVTLWLIVAIDGGSSDCWGLGSDAESYWLKPQCGQNMEVGVGQSTLEQDTNP